MGKKNIPSSGVMGTHARLELPSRKEGFDELFYVRMKPRSGFSVEAWKKEGNR